MGSCSLLTVVVTSTTNFEHETFDSKKSRDMSYSRASQARWRAMQICSSEIMFRDNTRSHSTSRIRNEFHRDSPFADREFGVPDYRSSSIEIRTTSPCPGAGGYFPRTIKRTLDIVTQHSNDQVPVYARGLDAGRSTYLLERTSGYPATDAESFRSPSYSRRSATPSSPYLGSYYSTYEHHSPARTSIRFRSPSPMRYSTKPRFQSRFMN